MCHHLTCLCKFPLLTEPDCVKLLPFSQVHSLDKFAGIHIKWDYMGRRCRISMDRYIDNLLLEFKHPHPTKPRCSPYKCAPIAYGTKTQLVSKADLSLLLDDDCKRCIQEIIGSLLYYARAVDNKLLVALSAITACQAKATAATELAVKLLLDTWQPIPIAASYLAQAI